MWLVALKIPKHVQDFLDQIGIEYTEIHPLEFRQVAERHGVTFEAGNDVVAPANLDPATTSFPAATRANRGTLREFGLPSQVETGPAVATPSALRWSLRGYDLVLVNRDAFDVQKFASLIEAFEQAVPSRRNARVGSKPAEVGR